MTDGALPKEQPTDDQKRTNQWWFPIGTQLRAKEHPISPGIVPEALYVVTREPWFAHDGHDAWTIEVKADGDEAHKAFVTEFVRVKV